MKDHIAYIARTKLKVLAWILGITLAAIGTISFVGLPILPTIGVAFAAAAMSIRKMASRLDEPTCLTCGCDLRHEPVGTHGIACPACGSINMPRNGSTVAASDQSADEDDEDARA